MNLVINKHQERKLIREDKPEETLNMIRTRRLENLFVMEIEENESLSFPRWDALTDQDEYHAEYK